jgi:hypothetical protein
MGWLSGIVAKFKKESEQIDELIKVNTPQNRKSAKVLGTEVTPAPLSHPEFITYNEPIPDVFVKNGKQYVMVDGEAVLVNDHTEEPIEYTHNVSDIAPEVMSKYLNVLKSPNIPQRNNYGVKCPFCEFEGTQSPYLSLDISEFVGHCVQNHGRTMEEARTFFPILNYLSFKKLI